MCDVVNIDYKSQSARHAWLAPFGPAPTPETVSCFRLPRDASLDVSFEAKPPPLIAFIFSPHHREDSVSVTALQTGSEELLTGAR